MCKTKVYNNLYNSKTREEFWINIIEASEMILNLWRYDNQKLSNPLEATDILAHHVKGQAYPDYLWQRVQNKTINHSGALAIYIKTTTQQLISKRLQQSYKDEAITDYAKRNLLEDRLQIQWEELDKILEQLPKQTRSIANTYLLLTVRHKEKNNQTNTETIQTATKRLYWYYKHLDKETVDQAMEDFKQLAKANWNKIITTQEKGQ